MFKVLGVDHIGVAVKDLEEGKQFWSDVIGIACTNQETVAEQKVTTTFHPTPNGSEIELLIGTADHEIHREERRGHPAHCAACRQHRERNR